MDFRDKCDIIQSIIRKPSSFQTLDEVYRFDRDITVEAVSAFGSNLYNTSCPLRDDYDIVLLAIKDDPWAINAASPRLKNDKSLALQAVSSDGWTLAHISEELKDDKEVVTQAILNYPLSIQHASQRLRGDCDIMKLAVKLDKRTLYFASQELKDELLNLIEEQGDYVHFPS